MKNLADVIQFVAMVIFLLMMICGIIIGLSVSMTAGRTLVVTAMLGGVIVYFSYKKRH